MASNNLLDDRTLRSSIQGSLRNGSVRTHRSSRSGTYSVNGGISGRSVGRNGEESRRIHNQVQAQIEKMFTDVAKDTTTCSFPVRCLGALPLKDKVTSLLGLQDPLRQLYLSGAGHGVSVKIRARKTLIDYWGVALKWCILVTKAWALFSKEEKRETNCHWFRGHLVGSEIEAQSESWVLKYFKFPSD